MNSGQNLEEELRAGCVVFTLDLQSRENLVALL